MADITKCTNEKCKDKKICYRHCATATPHQQSYAEFKPDPKTGLCKHYLPVYDPH